MAADIVDATGASVRGTVGELAIRQPWPGMTRGFWAEPDDERYLETYWRRIPGLWHHGDFAADDSDARAFVLVLELRDVFLDPAEQSLFSGWDQATAQLVAGFRESVGTDTDDPRSVQLVGELSLSSERFRQLWSRHDVQSRQGRPVLIRHPQVGDLILHREKPAIGGAEGQMLAVYHAQPGTSSAEKLGLVAFLASPTVTVSRDAIPPHAAADRCFRRSRRSSPLTVIPASSRWRAGAPSRAARPPATPPQLDR